MEKYAFNANLYVEGYMRKEATQKEDQYKIWMTDDELEELRRHAKNHRDDIILQLGGYVGSVLSRYRRCNLSTSNGPLTATIIVSGSPRGKSTTGNGREAERRLSSRSCRV
jgi:hypothetical protein